MTPAVELKSIIAVTLPSANVGVVGCSHGITLVGDIISTTPTKLNTVESSDQFSRVNSKLPNITACDRIPPRERLVEEQKPGEGRREWRQK